MSLVNVWVGATTPSSARVVAKVDSGSSASLWLADNEDFSGATEVDSTSLANDVAQLSASGLDASTRYWYRIEDGDGIDTGTTGTFLTHPPLGEPADFTIWGSSCALGVETSGTGSVLAADRLSNHAVFETIRSRALANDWLLGIHMGDLHYYDLGSDNHGITGGGSLANYRRSYDDVLLQPRQLGLYSQVPLVYMYDDHDWGPNNSDGTIAGRDHALQAYRERAPHYPLGDSDTNAPTYHAFQVGRVLFVISDVRADRSPNADPDGSSKTMLGSAQKAWMAALLEANTDGAEFLVWVTPSQWMRDGSDAWGSFATERDELVELFGDTRWLQRMCALSGDNHGLGIDTGGNNEWGGFPYFQFSSLDSTTEGTGHAAFDLGAVNRGPNRYGTLRLRDTGQEVEVTGRGWVGETLWRSHSFLAPVGGFAAAPAVALATVQELADVVSGSHEAVFEARVLTSFQSGDDPTGTEIPIIAGDVNYDATAEVWSSLELETVGIDEATGKSWFPRFADSLLAPYGNEIFVRRGVDAGGEGVLWSPLGIFRIESVEQQGPHSESPIRISGQDRMGAIVEAELVAPREYDETTSIAAVFADLVGDVYPDASIVFDDASGFQAIGRRLVVDESRYEPLLEMADSLGKVLYFDGEGVLRVEDPPEDDEPVWRVAAGRGGVMLSSARRVTREGAFNAVIVLGEGGGGDDPVRGVAVDNGPKSPTRWGGRFGRVPRTETLPQVTTASQAAAAARQILRRNLGAPFSADFTAVPNPALRPRHPVMVVQRDGNRELHVVETLSIPLVADGDMPATTRERTHIVIGAVIS